MEVGLVYEFLDSVCKFCMTPFSSVIETDYILWHDNSKEIKIVSEIQCPHCENFFDIDREDDEPDFFDDFGDLEDFN